MTPLARLGGIGLVALVVLIVAVAGITHAGPLPGGAPVATGPVSTSQQSGPFELTIRSEKSEYAPGEAIGVTATLAYHGPDEAVDISHDGGTEAPPWPTRFGIEEPVIGDLVLSPFSDLVCGGSTLRRDSPEVAPFAKAGAFSGEGPLASAYQAYFKDPVLRLPAGTWHIYAVADFGIGHVCGEATIKLKATITILIPDERGSIPTAPSPTPTTNPLDLPVGDDTQDGPIQATLESPHRQWKAGEPIDVIAGLASGDPAMSITAYGSSSLGPVAFSVRQLDGPVVITPERSAECNELLTLPLYERMEIPFKKSGTMSGATTADLYWSSWFADANLRLPAGTWEITATPAFSTSSDCATPGPNLRPTITIVVVP